MALTSQLIFILSSLTSVTVSTAVFTIVDSSVQLKIQDCKQPFMVLHWMYNQSFVLTYNQEDNTVEPAVLYNGRVEFNKDTCSLTLKHLQKNDSGCYFARLTDNEGENVVVEYNLSVLDPVETPILTPIPHQQNSTTCNVTLTCRGHKMSINYNCYNDVCEEMKITSLEGNVLSMYYSQGIVICNHSNPLSWKEGSIDMNKICFSTGPTIQLLNIIIAMSCVALSLSVAVIVYAIHIKKKKTDCARSQECDTVYAEVENNRETRKSATRLGADGPCLYSYVGMALRLQESKGHTQQHGDNVDQSLHNTYYTVEDVRSDNFPSTIYSTVDLSKHKTIYATVGCRQKNLQMEHSNL